MTATAPTADAPTETARPQRHTGPTVVIPAASLQRLIATVAPAAAGASHIPALLSVRLIGQDTTLTAQATDLSWGVEGSAPAQVTGRVDVCLAAVRFRDLVASFDSSQSVEIAVEGTEVRVRCLRSVSRFKTIDPEDFPAFPSPSRTLLSCPGGRIDLAADLLPWAASRVVGDSVNAVSLQTDPDGTVRLQASDRYVAVVWDGLPETDEGVIDTVTALLIPPRGLTELGKIARDKGEVTLSITGSPENPGHLVMDAGGEGGLHIRAAVRCLADPDKFPPLHKLIDHHAAIGAQSPTVATVTVDARPLLASLRRVLHFNDESETATGKSVLWTIIDGTLGMECRTREGEESVDAIPAQTEGPGVADGAESRVRYGSDLLRNLLKAVGLDATLSVTVPAYGKPTAITVDTLPGYRVLVMSLDTEKA